MRLSTWIAIIPTLAITIWFALANRTSVRFSLDPFNPETSQWAFEVPLFVAVFIGVGAGMLVGGLIVWLGQGRWRREARQQRREANRLAASISEAQATSKQNGDPE